LKVFDAALLMMGRRLDWAGLDWTDRTDWTMGPDMESAGWPRGCEWLRVEGGGQGGQVWQVWQGERGLLLLVPGEYLLLYTVYTRRNVRDEREGTKEEGASNSQQHRK